MFELPTGDFDALIFDCDGTLIDSMTLHHRAWQAALSGQGARFEFSWDVFMSRAGMGLPQTVRELNLQYDERLDAEAVVRDQRGHFERLMPDLTVIEEVASVVRAHHGHMPMAVASGGERRIVTRSLELVGLRHYFDPIICQDDVTHGKPNPEMFLRCASLMNVTPARCLVFEDGEQGIAAAIAAGMPYVRVPPRRPGA